jgi:hypothetical protein
MFDQRARRVGGGTGVEAMQRPAAEHAPGKQTRVEEVLEPAEMITREDGERMVAGMEAVPRIEAEAEAEAETGIGSEAEAEAEAEPETAPEARTKAESEAHAKQAGHHHHHGVPHSAYATEHRKLMRNYRYEAGALIENLAGEDFGAPNTYKPDAVPHAYQAKILHTVSVDISTVVGGWVLVFHKTYAKLPGHKTKKVLSGDHTGWIRIHQLPKSAQHAIAHVQHRLRHELAHGKGSGHKAKVKGHLHEFHLRKPETITDDSFLVRGGGDETSIGNYTHRPSRYGDVIIGVWNPPGSGAHGKRFGGSGGIRAFFPLTQKFHVTEVAPMHVHDVTGNHSSTWRYIAARLNHDTIYCWVLQSWTSPSGDGQNF